MSRRFGRNQKRRMREQLAEARAAEHMQGELLQGMRSTLARSRAEVDRLHDSIDRAARVIGAYSMALPARRLAVPHEIHPGDQVEVGGQLASGRWPSRMDGKLVERLDTLIARIKRDPHADAPGLHVRVMSRAGQVAYALDIQTLKHMGAEDAARLMADEMAPLLAAELRRSR